MGMEQATLLVLLGGMLVVFAIDRFRMEVVALCGLAVALALGLVAPAQAFSGLANPAFITVVEILLIVQVLGQSGILDSLSERIPHMARSQRGTIALLCAATACLSVVMNNIGALALMLPVVGSVCRVTGMDQRRVLMPVSFASLLGGLCSVIGTPANLIVSQQLALATGERFVFFDFAWVGVPATIAGIAVLVFRAWPQPGLAEAASGQPPHALRPVICEVRLPAKSAFVDGLVADFPGTVHGLRREGINLLFQRPGTRLRPGDVLVLQIRLAELETWVASGAVEFVQPGIVQSAHDRVEAVIMPESTLVGSRVGTLESLHSRDIAVIAVATPTLRMEGGLADLRLSIGDVLYLAGDRRAIADAVSEAEILPLWPREPGSPLDRRYLPAIVFGCGILVTAVGLLPPELAFGLVVLVLAASGTLNLRKGLGDLDWSILIMMAAMIPLGLAVESTGTASVLASDLMSVLPSAGPVVVSAAMLLIAVLVTPFVNNASTAIILAPIAANIALSTGIAPQPLLIAVALGASIDFLTPIGHHNNTIVMGLAGYRFSDFLKAGWPVTVVVVGMSIAALALAWL